MSLFYVTFDVYPTGMVTEQKIPLAADGKIVHFNFPGGDLTQKLYMVINQKLKAFVNNTKMDTPVKGIQRIHQFTPHEGNLIAIDIGTVHMTIDDASLPTTLFFVNSRQTVSLSVIPKISISFGVSDPERLAEDYCKGCVKDPMDSVRNAAMKAFQKAANEAYASASNSYKCDPTGFVNNLSSISCEMTDCITQDIALNLPWIRIDHCMIDLTASNSETIVSAVNEPYEMIKEILKQFTQAICDYYKVSACPPEISQILSAYISSNPGGIAPQELESICNKLIAVSRRASPEDMLSTAKKIGLLV